MYKSLFILLYFWLHNKNQTIKNLVLLTLFIPSLILATENLQKRIFVEVLISSFWGNFASEKQLAYS
jgi:hypothetical protein